MAFSILNILRHCFLGVTAGAVATKGWLVSTKFLLSTFLASTLFSRILQCSEQQPHVHLFGKVEAGVAVLNPLRLTIVEHARRGWIAWGPTEKVPSHTSFSLEQIDHQVSAIIRG